jgi:hypothetical protein
MELAEKCYQATKAFPREDLALTDRVSRILSGLRKALEKRLDT